MDPLAGLREAPRETALLFDVDGTLAPIVARPELAALPPATRMELERLAASYLLVACISGRPGEEAAALVGVEGIRYVGNHGLELDPRAPELAGKVAAFRDRVGLPVEDKGLSLSYHYREADDETAPRAGLEAVAERARVAEEAPPTGVTTALAYSAAIRALGGSVTGSSSTTQDLVVTVNFGEVSPANINNLVKVVVPVAVTDPSSTSVRRRSSTASSPSASASSSMCCSSAQHTCGPVGARIDEEGWLFE